MLFGTNSKNPAETMTKGYYLEYRKIAIGAQKVKYTYLILNFDDTRKYLLRRDILSVLTHTTA